MQHYYKYLWPLMAIIVISAIFIPLIVFLPSPDQPVDNPVKYMTKHRDHLDHSHFFNTPLKNGPQVTRACLKCHKETAREVMSTSHWQWLGDKVKIPGHKEPMRIGKKNLINNYCIGITGNWASCTSCHAGYGWKDNSYDFNRQENVDCLVCHDGSGTYYKQKAGLPGKKVDLLAVAKSVARPKGENCGYCHFSGGGGMGVKHGDLDSSINYPPERVDVHMGRYKMTCIDCHKTEKHLIKGRSMAVSVDKKNKVYCTDCHTQKPHDDQRLNTHTNSIGCKTCHIPLVAQRIPTKTYWDWSKAGQDIKEDPHNYLKRKGEFKYAFNLKPEYYWSNGTNFRYILGDKIDPEAVTKINAPRGDIKDNNSKIDPFKVHRGKQVYDKKNKYFLLPTTAGKGGYWHNFDWDQALRLGAEATGINYSGEYGFAKTEMFKALSHMVAPKRMALGCTDCHGNDSRFNWEKLGYEGDPAFSGERYKMHPPFPLLDGQGEKVLHSGGPLSTMKTCGKCHDTDYIARHNYHAQASLLNNDQTIPPESASEDLSGQWRQSAFKRINGNMEVNCLICHLKSPDNRERVKAMQNEQFEWSITATLANKGIVKRDSAMLWRWQEENFNLDGTLKKGTVNLRSPQNENCGLCHGLVHNGQKPVTLEKNRAANWNSAFTGQIISPQNIFDSGLNIKGKKQLSRPWDIHAARMLNCTACHHSLNNPFYNYPQQNSRTTTLSHLIYDRRGMNINKFLYRPSHQLVTGQSAKKTAAEQFRGTMGDCSTCHDAQKVHQWLPSKERHLQKLNCQACHVSNLYAPALRQVDWTVINREGKPRLEFRGIEENSAALNSLQTGYAPFLLPRQEISSRIALHPYNLVGTWYWAAGKEEGPINTSLLKDAFLENGNYRRVVMDTFDKDGDGQLNSKELKLDTKKKIEVIKQRFELLGLKNPQIKAKLEPFDVNHGISKGAWAIKECQTCHQGKSRLEESIALGSFAPGNIIPDLPKDTNLMLAGNFSFSEEGSLSFKPEYDTKHLYIFGHSRWIYLDILGLLLLIMHFLGAFAHGGLRFYWARARKKRTLAQKTEKSRQPVKTVYIYSVYNRVWHWIMAAGIIILIITGAKIRYPEIAMFLDFSLAVYIHKIVGVVVVLNGFLAFFHHLVTDEKWQFIPSPPRKFIQEIVLQVKFYTWGIFQGEDYPSPKTPKNRLNPLQKIVYLSFLNGLLMLQVITGTLMLTSDYWSTAFDTIGGMTMVNSVHAFLTWAFLCFLLLHIYMSTTGHTIFSNIKAMILGWEEVKIRDLEKEG